MLWNSVNTDVQVRFNDTDLQGVVWHGNYLSYLELGRFDWFEKMKNLFINILPDNYKFVIIEVNVQYISPAKFGDSLFVTTTLKDISRPQIIFKQIVVRNEKILINSETKVSALDERNRIVIFSKEIINKLKNEKPN